MFLILLIVLQLSLKSVTQTIDTIKGDKNFIELRLILDVQPDSANPKNLKAVFLSRSLDNGLELFQHPDYNRTLPVIVIIHGFHGNADKHNPHLRALIRNKYREKYNIFALNMPLYFDWSAGNLWYLLPALRAKFGGEAVGQLLNKAIDLELLSADMINLLGFSLGAQMSGYIARTVRGQVHSILGLDPAGPGFDSKLVQYNLLMTHVSKDDARYVHMYHTNSNAFGSTKRVATADFTFNNGWHQPGCLITTLIMCSHRRACMLFTSIINKPELFQAARCNSYDNFKRCRCRDNQVINLSFPPEPSLNGTYYITTSGQVPFGEGPLGAMCPKARLEKLIKDGVIKPNPSIYETIKKFKPTALLWGTTVKEKQTVTKLKSSDSTKPVKNKPAPETEKSTVTTAIDIDMAKNDHKVDVFETKERSEEIILDEDKNASDEITLSKEKDTTTMVIKDTVT